MEMVVMLKPTLILQEIFISFIMFLNQESLLLFILKE